MTFLGKTGEHDTSFDRQAHRAVIGHNNADFYSPIKSSGNINGRDSRSTGRKSEIHDDFMRSFKPSQVRRTIPLRAGEEVGVWQGDELDIAHATSSASHLYP